MEVLNTEFGAESEFRPEIQISPREIMDEEDGPSCFNCGAPQDECRCPHEELHDFYDGHPAQDDFADYNANEAFDYMDE